MEVFDIISELKTFYIEGVPYRDLDRHLTEADVLRWSAAMGLSRRQLFDEIAKCLALGFYSSEFSFQFCDAVVNDLFGPVTNTAGPSPNSFGTCIQRSMRASITTATIQTKIPWRPTRVR
jgi:hypothetical protein